MSDPTPVPVIVKSPSPLPVAIVNPSHQYQQIQSTDPSLPAKTTFQEDLTFAGQRKVNLIWEYTQAIIALLVMLATMTCGIIGMMYDIQIPTIISVAFGTITGFYFSRTNHAAIGGVGPKPSSVYEGR